MTGPDRIWIDRHGGNWSPMDGGTQDTEYVRRDPAVLAALPEVQALIAAACEVAAKFLTDTVAEWSCGHDARHCDCWRDKEQWSLAAEAVEGLTPADATAALARIEREAEARGMRAAAVIDWTSGRDVSDIAPHYLSDWQRGLVAGQNAMRDAILARAAEIEKEGK